MRLPNAVTWPKALTWSLVSLVVAARAAAAGGCKKSESSSNDDSANLHEQTPQEYFTQSVYPRIASQSACGGCHAGGASPCSGGSCQFIDKDAAATYSRIERTVGYISAPQKSPLLIYEHKDRTDVRTKVTGDQANVLGIWLGMEANTRHLPGAVQKARNLQDAYDQFAACMNNDVFVGTGMENLAFMETDFDGPCSGCHSKGQAGLWLASDPTLTFESMKKFPYIQKFVVGRVDSSGNFKDLIPAGRIVDKSNEPCPVGSDSCHPQYGVSEEMKASIEQFVNLTLQNLAAQTCQNGIVTDPDADAGTLPDGGTP